MGLDITSYSNLSYVGHCPDAEEDEHGYDTTTYEVRHVRAYAYTAFPHALAGVPNVEPMRDSWGKDSFIDGGCFAVTGKTETHGFRAGSYGGYSQWRGELAALFNPYPPTADRYEIGQPNPEGPFYQLLWFADNEGTLSELCAVQLLADFRRHEVEYAAHQAEDPMGEYNVQRYRDWTRACELAADGGLIDFH